MSLRVWGNVSLCSAKEEQFSPIVSFPFSEKCRQALKKFVWFFFFPNYTILFFIIIFMKNRAVASLESVCLLHFSLSYFPCRHTIYFSFPCSVLLSFCFVSSFVLDRIIFFPSQYWMKPSAYHVLYWKGEIFRKKQRADECERTGANSPDEAIK